MQKQTTKTVDEIGGIAIQGNIIPDAWYKTIVKENGKPYLEAIIILSDILYWYRPTYLRDEFTGQTIGIKKKFKADKLQRNYKGLSEKFGFSSKVAGQAVRFLKDLRVITLELRDIKISSGTLQNVMFIEPVPLVVKSITFPDNLSPKRVLGQVPNGYSAKSQTGGTYTETTTEPSNSLSKELKTSSSQKNQNPVNENPTFVQENRENLTQKKEPQSSAKPPKKKPSEQYPTFESFRIDFESLAENHTFDARKVYNEMIAAERRGNYTSSNWIRAVMKWTDSTPEKFTKVNNQQQQRHEPRAKKSKFRKEDERLSPITQDFLNNSPERFIEMHPIEGPKFITERYGT